MEEVLSSEEQAIVERPKPEPKEPAKVEEVKADAGEVKSEVQEEKTEVKERKPPKNPDAKVPIGALHQARRQIDEWKAKSTDWEKKFVELQAKVSQPIPEMPADVKADPVAAVEAMAAREQRQREMAEFRQAQEQRNNDFVETYRAAAQEYAAENQNFPKAYAHLYEMRVSQLEAVGFTKQDAVRLAENEERNIVLKALNDGVNPAERLYNLSVRMGFSVQDEPEATASQPSDDQQKRVMEKLDTIEKGVKASKSLSTASGGAEPPPSLKAILDMDEDELSKMDKKAFRKALGG